MLDNETKRRIDTARNILVGKVPDPKSQVEQITIALIYKFMNDMDAVAEELGGSRTFFSGEFERYSWNNLMAPGMGGYDVLNLYAEAIQKMDFNPNIPTLFRDIFKNAFLHYRDPQTLKMFLKVINDFSYDHSEKLGDAFEYLLSVLGSQGDAGQFRTPRHIIDFMVEVVNPQKNDTILDPACGTAGFLISAYKHIVKTNTKKGKTENALTPDERTTLAENIRGYDISPDMVRLSLVNLYLHGFQTPNIFEYDTLTSQDRWNEYADVILANPPFMSPKGGIRPHKRFSVQSKRSEVLFVDYMCEHLTPNGKAGIIVPEGIIFQSSNAYKQLREMLVKNYLYAIVSLPAGVFQPYSGVKTSILLIDKKIAKRTDKILFVKIENDGFGLGAQRRPIEKNDLPNAIEIINNWKTDFVIPDTDRESFAHVIEKDKIAESGDWNLSGERYRESSFAYNSNFEMLPIGEICKLINGRAFKPIDWEKEESGGLEIVRIQNLNNPNARYNYYTGDVLDKYLIQNGELLFSWSGSRGTSFGAHNWKGGKAVLNQHIFKVLFESDKADKQYLFYALNKAVKQVLENLHGGVGLVHITKGNLEKIKIPLPPLEIQKEIVAEIEGYQKIIDGAKAVVENYEPQIQIEPEWEMVELGSLAKFIQGTQIPKELQNTTKVEDYERFIRIVDYTQENKDIRYIKVKESNNKCSVYDLIMVRYGASAGFIGRGLEGVFANNLFKIDTDSKKVVNGYLFFFFKSSLFADFIKNNVMQAAMPALSHRIMSRLRLPLPPINIQKVIVNKIENELILVNANKELINIFELKIKDRIARVWGE